MPAAEPLRHLLHGEPGRCPECGGRRLGQVRPEDLEVWPLDPRRAPNPYPGTLACRDCGAVVSRESRS